ncbi:hypothetical protein ACS2CR_26475 [Bacillus cereus group sp. BceL291]|uniref:hypothetical protein n=1 Tax=Bacillus cereus group TaxID=86661 RepID=UPI001F0DD547|nr:hypothetical protein [Bacillus cereus]MCH5460842.1 hypothetical protein [Bacillus cereus]
MRGNKMNSDMFLWVFGIVFIFGYSFWATGRPGDEALNGLIKMFGWIGVGFITLFVIWGLIYTILNGVKKGEE